MKRPLILLMAAHLSGGALAQPQAFEVAPDQLDRLPQGKEADGIVGDFVLKNDRVAATVSRNAWDRRANMSTFYGADGITPGCLYDLALGGLNDQLTIFAPANQRGEVSWVRVVSDGSDGEAVVETVTTAALNKGVFRRHAYHLRDGWQGVLVTSTFRNESAEPRKIDTGDRWTNFSQSGEVPGIRWADAVDPADRAGYAVEIVPGELTLAPGEEKSLSRFVAVGRSPAEAVSVILARTGDPARLQLTVRDGAGQPVTTARAEIPLGGKTPVPAYPDDSGKIEVVLPTGSHQVNVSDIGRPAVSRQVQGADGARLQEEVVMEPASAVTFRISGPDGALIPCKAHFALLDAQGADIPLEQARKSLNLGPQNRAHGCVDQWHSATGEFRVALPAGKYRVTVTRGPEFSHLQQVLDVPAGQEVPVHGQLQRLVDTRGWVSADFHNHSTPSGDNTCGTDDRIINLAAEHIEFAPTTEHNRLYDWTPHIEKLGLRAHLTTVPGIELTGSTEHLNSFPFEPVPGQQDNGAPKWNPDPRISALTLRNHQKPDPDRWVQVNHPNLEQCFVDADKDGVVDGGYFGVGQFIDAWEIENFLDEGLFAQAPFSVEMAQGSGLVKRVRYQREYIWLQLLNQGLRLRCVAVADAHSVYGNGVGGWRMYLPSSTDEAGRIDWREMARAAREGNSYVTTAPFLQVTAQAAGQSCGPGADLAAPGGRLEVRVRVQCSDWYDIDRIQFFINGRQPAEYNFTRASHPDWFGAGVVKFDRAIPVTLTEDAHLIVVAVGENSSLATCFGTSAQSKLRPLAYNNPIYVDIDGQGWTHNGDTLGFDLPVSNLSAEKVGQLLGTPAPQPSR